MEQPSYALSTKNGHSVCDEIEVWLTANGLNYSKEVTGVTKSVIGGWLRHDFVVEGVPVEVKSQMSDGGDMWQKSFYTIHNLKEANRTSVFVFKTGPKTKKQVIERVVPAIRKLCENSCVKFFTFEEFIDAINEGFFTLAAVRH